MATAAEIYNVEAWAKCFWLRTQSGHQSFAGAGKFLTGGIPKFESFKVVAKKPTVPGEQALGGKLSVGGNKKIRRRCARACHHVLNNDETFPPLEVRFVVWKGQTPGSSLA